MVRFYHLCSLGSALDNVRINRSLSKEIDSFQFSRFFLENTDKFSADNLSLLFRIRYIFQLSKETLCSVYINQICMKLVAEYLYNAFRFIFPHRGNYGRIYAA